MQMEETRGQESVQGTQESVQGGQDSAQDQGSVQYCGFKLVGDNVDKNVKPSLQQYELKGQSLHHFHAFATRDWVSTSSLSDVPPAVCTPTAEKLLPSPEDIEFIKNDMTILISR